MKRSDFISNSLAGNLRPVLKGDKWGLVNPHNLDDVVIDCKLDIRPFSWFDFLKIRYKRKVGLIDSNGKEILPPIYEEISKVNPDMWKVVDERGFCGILDKDFKQILPCEYQGIIASNGNFVVKKEELYGVITKNKTWVLPMKYDNIFDNCNGYSVKSKTGWGFYNLSGEEVLECKYERIEAYEKYIKAYINKICILYTPQGELILKDSIYSDIFPIQKDMFKVTRKSYQGIVKASGDVVIPLIYSRLIIRDNFILAENKKGKCGVIDYNNKQIVPFKYEDIETCGKKLCAVYEEDKIGFVSDDGKQVTPIIYKSYYELSGNDKYIVVKINLCYGLIDLKGNEVLKPIYDKISYLTEDNTVYVEYDGYEGAVMI